MDSGKGGDALTGDGEIRRAADCEAEAEARPRRRRAARRAAMVAGEGAGGGGGICVWSLVCEPLRGRRRRHPLAR
jgi:hypothetical protein